MHGSIYLRQRWIQAELFCRLLERGPRPRHGLFQIVRVELDADETHAQRRARDGGTAKPQEWIDRELHAVDAVKFEAVGRQPPRKGGRMRPLLVAALNRVVGKEPGVAAAA